MTNEEIEAAQEFLKKATSEYSLMCHSWDLIDALCEAARQPDADEWYCPACQVVVAPRDVTYQETHDVRAGGCGSRVGGRPEQPKSLVGRRVRLRTCHEITGTVKALAAYSVEWDTGVTADAGPSILEPLEDTDA
jgi:hypothetical protein